MKMKEKQKERLIQILEVLKQQNCIKSYTVTGEDAGSIVPEWMDGGVNRVFDEVSKPARPFGLRQHDRGLLALLLPEERREELLKVMLTAAKESASRLLKQVSNSY